MFVLPENGMLASRIEILTRYHNEIVHKMGKFRTAPPSPNSVIIVCPLPREEDSPDRGGT